MRFVIEEPTRAIIEDATDAEISFLRKELTYTNTSISYQLSRHKKNKYFQRENPDGWQEQMDSMQSKLKKTLVFKDNEGRHYIRPGSIPYIASKVDATTLRAMDVPEFRGVGFSWKTPFPYSLYPYQEETVQRLMAARHGAAQLATGLGKTAVMLTLVKRCGLQAVVVVPSKSIFLEVLEFFSKHLGSHMVGAFGNGKKQIGKKVTVCIAKSLVGIKFASKEWHFFQNAKVICSDESHLNAAETLESVFHGVLSAAPYRFFVSGTQTRGDGAHKLLQSIVGPMVIDLDTAYGIANGFLNNLEFHMVKLPSSNPKYWSGNVLKMTQEHFLYNTHALDFSCRVANLMGKKGLSSLFLVEEIDQIAEIVKRLEVPHTYVHGNTLRKEELEAKGLGKTDMKTEIDRFNSGEVRVLIGTSCISTGTNFYPTHNTFNLQGGASEIGTKQGAIGRSVRKLDISRFKDMHVPKPVSKVWDFEINEEKMARHFGQRLRYYEETGCKIVWYEPFKEKK